MLLDRFLNLFDRILRRLGVVEEVPTQGSNQDEEGGPYLFIAVPFFLSFLFLRLRQRFLDAGSAAAGRFVFFQIAVIHICHRVHSLSYIKITFLIIAGFCQRNRKNPFFL